ncbi:MAG: protein kinase domain-containing protein [Bryobacteraceae bacterium]
MAGRRVKPSGGLQRADPYNELTKIERGVLAAGGTVYLQPILFMEEQLPHAYLSHYRILSRLGAGGMGDVYLAEDTRLGRRVAIKVLPAAFTADAERVRRFMIEAKAASALNHPHIITVHDIGESEAGRYLVMEAVEGRTVRGILAEGCSIAGLVALGVQMAKGLAAAHAAGITHRDIKPENIMVRHDGYVKILDFGLARLAPSAPGDLPANSTEPGLFMGTLKYMSPEQARGEIVTPASDIYSLGMVFFELATGRYPFPDQTFMAVLHAIQVRPPGAPSALNPALPADLDALICRMLDKDALLRPTAVEVGEALQRERMAPTDSTMRMPAATVAPVMARHTVGRKRELQELRAALQMVGAGRGALVCISGEPGIGKSTLVEEFLGLVGTEGICTIARGRCSERLAGTEAYLPLLGALDNLLRSGSEPGLARVMKELAPAWYAQISTSSSSDGVTAASQDRLKRELGTFLLEAARARPILLFFDDLHWADVSTIDILTYLASQFDGLRMLVVVTYRPSDMLLAKHPFLRIKPDLQARGLLRELTLSFLTGEEIGQYLVLEFPAHRFPVGFPGLIHAKTEGSPLFMADLVRYLRDRGVISSEGTLARELPEIERDLPESVRGMIERKIGQLNEEDRKLLSAASVQGYEFDSAVLARILGMDADVVEERLETLERVYSFVRLVREAEFPNHQLTLRYRFVHVLYQNALFTALRATRRVTLSRDVALALESFWGVRRGTVANELAVLWEAARDFGQAAAYFTMAARHAGQVFADQEAVVLARRGVAALAITPETPERTDQELVLQVVLGVALRTVRGFADPEVGRAFGRARELCPASGQTLRLVPVLRGLWEFYEVQADYQNALPYGRQLLSLAEHLEDEGVLVVACDVMGDTSVWLGEFGAAWEHLGKGIGLYDAEKHRAHLFLYGYDTGMACCSYGAIALWNLGYPSQALARGAEANAIAGRLAHPVTKAFAAIMAAWLQRLCGDLEAALAEGERAVAISTEYGLPYFLGFGQITRGWALVGLGRVDAGIADIRAGMEVYRATGSELGVSLWLGCLAEGYRAAGRVSEALTVLEQAFEFVGRTGERVFEAELWRMKGELAGSEGCLQKALEVARRQGARGLELRAAMSLARFSGDGKPLRAIYGSFTEGFSTGDLVEAAELLR